MQTSDLQYIGTIRARMALQTAAVRRNNGLVSARATYYGIHVTCSAHVPLSGGR